jgi:hypothetical protein
MHDGILELFRIPLEGNDTCAMHAGGQVLERDAATCLTHEARAAKHYIKMSMGKPLLELEPAPPPPRRQISCQYLTLQLCSLGLCYCSDLPCERIRFDTSRWSAVILLCGIILRTFDSSSFRSAAPRPGSAGTDPLDGKRLA